MPPGLTDILHTARDALSAQSYGLGVTGQNISNVNTPAYARREALLETHALGTQTTGTVYARGLRQVTDIYIDRRNYEARGNASAATEHDQQLQQLENLFNDAGGTGLASALSGIFSSFSALAANPSDNTVRATVLERVGNFANRANQTADAIASQQSTLLQKAQQTTQQINEQAQQIAKLNLKIAFATSQGQDAADLIDQRNKVILNISDMVDVRTIGDPRSGELTIQASGTTIVDGGTARSLGVDLDSAGKIRILAMQTGAPTGDDITAFLTGGTLAGIKQARDVDLFNVADRFDQFVFDVSTAINQQHQAGFGKDGNSGRNIFEPLSQVDGAGRVLRVSIDVFNQPDRIAAASSAGTLPGGSDNAAALSMLSNKPVVFGNTRSAAQAYGDIVGGVAEQRSASQRAQETQKAISEQIQAMHQAVSGVSLDEEMVSLTKFQRAYQAAGQLLTTVDQLLGELINRVGR